VKTLAQLRNENPLDASKRIKVNRAAVRQIMVASLLSYPFKGAWTGLFDRMQSD